MITIRCRDLHDGKRRALCPSCAELAAYAEHRLLLCPFGQGKPTCARCAVHCYRPEMRERVRQVMRHAGPKMLLRHPIDTLLHLVFDSHRPAPARPTPTARRASQAPQPDH